MKTESLEELRVFVQVVESMSLTAAGRVVGMSTNTVSRRLARLEERLEVSLLQRTTRSLGLTTEGRRFYESAVGILEAVRAAEDALGPLRPFEGILRVALPTLLADLVADELADFCATYPRLSVELLVRDSAPSMVEEGIDLAFTVEANIDPSVVEQSAGSLGGHVVASPAYLDREGRPADVTELSKHRCLRFLGPIPESAWDLTRDGVLHRVPVTGTFAATSSRVLVRACVLGLGIGIVPTGIARPLEESGALERVLPAWETRRYELSARYPPSRRGSEVIHEVIRLVRRRMAES